MEAVSSQSSGKFSSSFQKRKRRILCTFPDVVQKKLFVRPGLLLLVLIAAAAVVAVAGRVLQHHANTNTNVKSRLLANWKHHGSVVTTMDWSTFSWTKLAAVCGQSRLICWSPRVSAVSAATADDEHADAQSQEYRMSMAGVLILLLR